MSWFLHRGAAHHEAEGEGVESTAGGIVQVVGVGPELHETQQLAEPGVHVPQDTDHGGLEDGTGAAHRDVAVLSCQAHQHSLQAGKWGCSVLHRKLQQGAFNEDCPMYKIIPDI